MVLHKRIFLIPITHINPAMMDKPKGPLAGDAVGRTAQAPRQRCRQKKKDVPASGISDELHVLGDEYRLNVTDVGLKQDGPNVLGAPPGKQI